MSVSFKLGVFHRIAPSVGFKVGMKELFKMFNVIKIHLYFKMLATCFGPERQSSGNTRY
jgi:hypothetical protein